MALSSITALRQATRLSSMSWKATIQSLVFVVAWLFLTGFRAGVDYSIFHYYGNATLTADAGESSARMGWFYAIQQSGHRGGRDRQRA